MKTFKRAALVALVGFVIFVLVAIPLWVAIGDDSKAKLDGAVIRQILHSDGIQITRLDARVYETYDNGFHYLVACNSKGCTVFSEVGFQK